jgi:hypothetical protein
VYKRVLVTLDGSPLAEAILPFITEIAPVFLMRLTERQLQSRGAHEAVR